MTAPVVSCGVVLVNRRDEIFVCHTTGTARWDLPKGLADPAEDPRDAAVREAWEEAGLKGRLIGDVGIYEYEKWNTTFAVAVYLMEVLEQHDEWQEAGLRERRWTSFSEATSLLRSHPVRPLLDRANDLVRV